MDLRCEHKLHGIVLPDGRVEIKCDSQFCGAGPGLVVLHRFDLHTGAVETKCYKVPRTKSKETADGDCDNVVAIRAQGR